MTEKKLFPALNSTIDQLKSEFHQIPTQRKEILQQLSQYIQNKIKDKQKVYLNFICTHNSRRSHIAQLWAQVASHYYGQAGIACFSGGTEATAFNYRAVKAMSDVGFKINKIKDGENPTYEVHYTPDAPPISAFSKKYDDPFNPDKDFAAVMTCSQADENCPFVLGASARISLNYDDPKNFDGTPQEVEKYTERVLQIGREILYACHQATI